MAFSLISSNDPQNMANEINKNILELKNNEVTQYFKDDTGTRRVQLGKGADGFYGLKVSQEGYDVFTASNDQLVFNSDNNTFKIVAQGEVTLTVPNTANIDTTSSVAHGLSHRPAVIMYATTPINAGGENVAIPWLPVVWSAGNTEFFVRGSAYYVIDDTNIEFHITHDGKGILDGDWIFKYYLLQETAN